MPKGIVLADAIAITGHRIYPDRSQLYRGLDQLHAKQYYFGGARGVDSDALEYLGRTQPGSMRTVVVPNRLSDQPRLTIGITKRYSTRIIELKNTGTDRYFIRNRYLVDNTDHVRAFYDHRKTGGTYQTINYAHAQGKPVTITSLVETDLSVYRGYSEPAFRSWMNKQRSNGMPLHSIKGIISGYFKGRRGYIPTDVVKILRAW